MVTWERAHQQAALESSNLHGELGINIERPIDVFAAVERLGLVLAFAPMEKGSGVYIPASRPGSLAGILIHQGHPRSRQRFTAGHELGHHQFGHGFEIDMEHDQRLLRSASNLVTDEEKQAEAFATWFLMPRRLLRAGMRELEITLRRPDEVYALSLWLGTSYQATVLQLETTRLLSADIAQSWRTVKPKAIKLGLVGDNEMDFRRDVWWIDHTTLSNPIDVRPGDRLILRLPEDPTTGYSWRPSTISGGLRVQSDSFDDWWEPSRSESSSLEAQGFRGSPTRSLLLAVPAETTASVQQLRFELTRAWSDDEPVDEYEILLSVTPSARGLQLDPEELVSGA